MSRKSHLWTGYPNYECHRGTIDPLAVSQVAFAAPVSHVQVEHLGILGSIIATLDGTTPTATGLDDTNSKMIEVPSAQSRSADKHTVVVKLRSSVAAPFQVIGLR